MGVCWGAAPAEKVVLKPSQARLLEMQVELAWLSDPVASPCDVRAKWMGAALEVQGLAPSSIGKQRALELAQQLSPAPILDGVRIVPGQGALRRPAGGSLADLSTRLSQHAAALRVQGLVVWPEADGRMSVSGSVGSVEEKLAVSKALRELGVGASVSNRLVVRPVVHSGQLVTQVSADGRHVVMGRPTLGPESDSTNLGFLPVPADPSGTAQAHVPTRHKPRRSTVEFASARNEGRPAAPAPLPSALREPSRAAMGGYALRTRPERVWPPAHEVRPRKEDAPEEEAPKVVARTKASPAKLPAPETAEEAEATPPPTPAVKGSAAAQQLKQSIDRLCGRFAHYVEIIEHPGGRMVVRIQVPSDALEELLLSRLLTIPQVASSQVQLEAIVKP